MWHLFLSDLIDAVFPATDSVPSDRNHQEVFSSLHPEEEMPKDRVQGVSITGGALSIALFLGYPLREIADIAVNGQPSRKIACVMDKKPRIHPPMSLGKSWPA